MGEKHQIASQNNKKEPYQVTETEPLSITITERRWKLLGNILTPPADCPARKALRYYFEGRTNKKFVKIRRTTIVTTINEEIRRTKEKDTNFPFTQLIFLVSLLNIHKKAKNRELWQKVVSQVVESVYFL